MGLHAPPAPPLRILIVDRDAAARQTLKSALELRISRPLAIVESDGGRPVDALLADGAFDAAAVDLDTAGGPDGFADLLRRIGRATAYALGSGDHVMEAVAAVRSGAADFIEKPLDGKSFARRIERQFAGTGPDGRSVPVDAAGRSGAMQSLFRQIARIAGSAAPVFVFGESGTGKSTIARAIHARSRRWQGPFVAFDCSAHAGGAGEALFGDGGALDRADGGTLHLSRIDRLDDGAQAMLIGYLDGGTAGRSGSLRRPSVRIVASRGIEPGAPGGASRGIREDLWFRLNVLALAVPALRDRTEDIAPLLEAAMHRTASGLSRLPPRLSAAAAARLASLPFPRNLADLEDLARRLVAEAPEGGVIEARMLEAGAGAPPAGAGAARRSVVPLWMAEARIIEEALEAFDGNVALAAAALEISPSTIYRKRKAPGTPGRILRDMVISANVAEVN